MTRGEFSLGAFSVRLQSVKGTYAIRCDHPTCQKSSLSMPQGCFNEAQRNSAKVEEQNKQTQNTETMAGTQASKPAGQPASQPASKQAQANKQASTQAHKHTNIKRRKQGTKPLGRYIVTPVSTRPSAWSPRALGPAATWACLSGTGPSAEATWLQ